MFGKPKSSTIPSPIENKTNFDAGVKKDSAPFADEKILQKKREKFPIVDSFAPGKPGALTVGFGVPTVSGKV